MSAHLVAFAFKVVGLELSLRLIKYGVGVLSEKVGTRMWG